MVHAYVLAEAVPGGVVRAARLVAQLPGVRSAEVVTGPYDFIVDVEVEDVGELAKIVLNGIRAVEGVTRTLTCRSAPEPVPVASAVGF
jgi:DNA-binding Lrp family transcriptional regulator